jgi:hypothetical protein
LSMGTTRMMVLAAAAVVSAGCGSTMKFANRPRPPTPVDLTAFVNNQRVLLSPASVGGGPLVLLITNQASRSVTLMLLSPSGGTLASTGPINPNSTQRVTVDTTGQGTYLLSPGGRAGIRAATLRVGPERPNGDNVLLQP